MLTKIDVLNEWVNDPESSQREKKHREAVHILLYAIAKSDMLNTHMLMKGGTLLAIRYASSRYTTDVDFSTNLALTEEYKGEFTKELEQQLSIASEELDYGMVCKIQSLKVKPKEGPNVTWPSFLIKIGYAYKHDRKGFKRLVSGRSLDVVKIDYSFNEPIQTHNPLVIHEDISILVYSFEDLVAEKIRAVLQQKARKRNRRQDIYDLYYLLKANPSCKDLDKKLILNSLIVKSESRDLMVDIHSLCDPEIIERSRHDYDLLEKEIEGSLLPFDEAYEIVNNFYKSLPWE